ncbi:hypothetical protein I308_103225 [Cryptococcus tetragattii IND107]|uniref:Uncharacterized protein n=1 Tax=Cryptococcus tetragattii IND107 TaxID=1296105 RepID=A0ABR3BU14_9TREE
MKNNYLLSSRANPLSLQYVFLVPTDRPGVRGRGLYTSYSLVIYYKYFSIYIDWVPNSYTSWECLFITPPKLASYCIRL